MLHQTGLLYTMLLRKKRRRILLLFVMMLIASLLEVIGIGLIPAFILALSDPQIILSYPAISGSLKALDITSQRSLLILGGLLLLILYVVKNIYLAFYHFVKKSLITDLSVELQYRLFSKYLLASYSFYIHSNSSELLRNIISEVHRVVDNVLMPLLELFLNVVMVVLIVLLLVIVEPYISLIAFMFLGGMGIFFNIITRSKIVDFGKKDLAYRHQMNKAVIEGLGGFKDARVLGVENNFLDQYQRYSKKSRLNNIYLYMVRQIPRPATELLAVITMLIITFILILQGRSVSEVIPVLALYGAASIKLMPMLVMMISNISMIRYNKSSVDIVSGDLSRLRQKAMPNNMLDNKTSKLKLNKEITLENVSYQYPASTKNVICDVSIKISKGTAVAFVGESGSGKTTLVDVILGLLPPNQGTIKIDGISIGENLKAWQKNIGYIPQSIFLLDDTIRKNIAFGMPEDLIDNERINEVIDLARLRETIEDLPEKEDSTVGERGIRLSGGQRQRIGIARALYHDPEILILDEATSSLDSITESFIIESIERLKGGRTIIMIAHRLSTVMNCDKIYIFESGKITEQGNYNELIRSNKQFREFADRQTLSGSTKKDSE